MPYDPDIAPLTALIRSVAEDCIVSTSGPAALNRRPRHRPFPFTRCLIDHGHLTCSRRDCNFSTTSLGILTAAIGALEFAKGAGEALSARSGVSTNGRALVAPPSLNGWADAKSMLTVLAVSQCDHARYCTTWFWATGVAMTTSWVDTAPGVKGITDPVFVLHASG